MNQLDGGIVFFMDNVMIGYKLGKNLDFHSDNKVRELSELSFFTRGKSTQFRNSWSTFRK